MWSGFITCWIWFGNKPWVAFLHLQFTRSLKHTWRVTLTWCKLRVPIRKQYALMNKPETLKMDSTVWTCTCSALTETIKTAVYDLIVSTRDKHMQYHIRWVIRGQAEVSDLHVILRVQEDVDRLQVSVDHSLWNRHYITVRTTQSWKWNFCINKSKVGLYTSLTRDMN